MTTIHDKLDFWTRRFNAMKKKVHNMDAEKTPILKLSYEISQLGLKMVQLGSEISGKNVVVVDPKNKAESTRERLRTIFEWTCEYMGKDKELVSSPKRSRELVVVRQLYCYLAKQFMPEGTTLKSIAEYIGFRDHSTVIYSIRTVNDLIDTDQKFASMVSQAAVKCHRDLEYLFTSSVQYIVEPEKIAA